MNDIKQRYSQTHEQIVAFNQKYQRSPDSVKLLAVSKRKPITDIQTLYQLGQRDFAENYLQEALVKISSINAENIIWHFIGPIQSNKTKLIAENFNWVHSVDRIKIAERLSNARPNELSPLNICVQINISDESTKSGIKIDELPAFAAAISKFPNLNVRGLMALPLPSDNFSTQLEQFKQLSDLYHALNHQGFKLDTLSMGTSHDMEAAIAAGSTMIRIGTALFGPRD